MIRAHTRHVSALALLAALSGFFACSNGATRNEPETPTADAGDDAADFVPDPEDEGEGPPPTDAGAPDTPTDAPTDGGDAAPTDTGAPTDAATDATDAATALTQAEVDLLVFTREEEKLARDVYLSIEATYPIFQNIAESEQAHMDAVLVLLERYGIADPAAGNAVGEFTDPALQALYDQLVEKAALSQIDAVQVGLQIEELDIRDLTAALELTDRADIETVLQNLLRGSRNHLRAFYDQLIRLGGTYTPQYLDEATFLAIATSEPETGGPPGF